MLFDPLLKKNRAEAEEQAWTKNAPAEYESRNKADMDALTGQVGSGFDWDTASKAYQQYRDRVTGEAQDAAANAQANAAMLAGGYGSSYADSVAKQGQQQALAGIDNAVPQLRSQALTEYQNRQSGLLEALSGMANTEALDQSAYGSNLANYNNRLNFLQNQSAQARSENDNYWNNLWNGITQAGGVLLDAYDGYKGYTQQKQQATAQALNYAVSLKAQGADDAAYAVLDTYGIDRSVLDNYTGQAPVTRDQQASILSTAASLVAAGNQEAAENLLKLYGMDAGSAGSYDTLTQRDLAKYMSKKSTGSSGGGGGSGSFYTSSNITSLLNKLAGLQEGTPAYNAIASELAKAGVDVSASDSYNRKISLSDALAIAKQRDSLAADDANRSWYQNLLNEGGYGDTAASDDVLNRVYGYVKKGYNASAITVKLKHEGYSDEEIANIFNRIGV